MNVKSSNLELTCSVLVVFIVLVCLGVSGCAKSHESEDESGACLPLGHYPDQSSWPYFSECLKDPNDDEPFACSSESVLLSWDGENLAVRHECIPGQCGWEFEHEFSFEEQSITLIERDTATEVAGCSCKFRGAFKTEVEPGAYEFRIVADDAAWGGEVLTRLSEPVELPPSENAEYCFHIVY